MDQADELLGVVHDTLVESLVDTRHFSLHNVVEVGVCSVDLANFANLCLRGELAHVLTSKDSISPGVVLSCQLDRRAAHFIDFLLVM